MRRCPDLCQYSCFELYQKIAHEVGLGSDFERDAVQSRFGVVNGLCTRLDVL